MVRPHSSILRLLPADDVHGHIHQAAVVEVSLPDLDQEDLDLVPGPPATSSQRPQCNGLGALQQDLPPVLANYLQVRMLRPGAKRHVEDALVNINEAGLAHHGTNLTTSGSVEVDTQICQALVDETPVLRDGMVWRHCVVGRYWVVVDLLRFDPSTGLEMAKDALAVLVSCWAAEQELTSWLACKAWASP